MPRTCHKYIDHLFGRRTDPCPYGKKCQRHHDFTDVRCYLRRLYYRNPRTFYLSAGGGHLTDIEDAHQACEDAEAEAAAQIAKEHRRDWHQTERVQVPVDISGTVPDPLPGANSVPE